MMQMGFFSQIFLRVIGLIIFVVTGMFFFNHVHEQRALLLAWQDDLQQEAEWTGRHWAHSQQVDNFTEAWHATHDGVRLQIYDSAGELVADSKPTDDSASDATPENAPILIGRSPIQLGDDMGELVLSRGGITRMGVQTSIGLLLAALALVAIAALVLFPLIKTITDALSRVSVLAARVAEGEFGETIPEKGNRDTVALIRSFNEMSIGLKAAEQKSARLLSDVSHELRSPLGRMVALVETVQRHPEEVEDLSVQIGKEVSLMDRLIGDVLDSSRFEAPETHLELHDADLCAWSTELAAQIKTRIESAGIAFEQNIGATAAHASFDSHRLMQVMGNVVDNAIKAVSETPRPIVKLETSTRDDMWICRFSDNGVGIPESDLPFVFDRFYRIDAGRNRALGGSGLGLSICKAIVVAHDGQIAVTSQEGQGTLVEIQIPLRTFDAKAQNHTLSTNSLQRR